MIVDVEHEEIEHMPLNIKRREILVNSYSVVLNLWAVDICLVGCDQGSEFRNFSYVSH